MGVIHILQNLAQSILNKQIEISSETYQTDTTIYSQTPLDALHEICRELSRGVTPLCTELRSAYLLEYISETYLQSNIWRGSRYFLDRALERGYSKESITVITQLPKEILYSISLALQAMI